MSATTPFFDSIVYSFHANSDHAFPFSPEWRARHAPSPSNNFSIGPTLAESPCPHQSPPLKIIDHACFPSSNSRKTPLFLASIRPWRSHPTSVSFFPSLSLLGRPFFLPRPPTAGLHREPFLPLGTSPSPPKKEQYSFDSSLTPQEGKNFRRGVEFTPHPPLSWQVYALCFCYSMLPPPSCSSRRKKPFD